MCPYNLIEFVFYQAESEELKLEMSGGLFIGNKRNRGKGGRRRAGGNKNLGKYRPSLSFLVLYADPTKVLYPSFLSLLAVTILILFQLFILLQVSKMKGVSKKTPGESSNSPTV